MERVRKIIEENRKKILIVIGILIAISIGISYAYFTEIGVQEGYNTIRSGCLSITITEESEAIKLEKTVPVTVEEGLRNEPYTFTIKNNCSEAAPYQVSLESIDRQETTMGIENIHISLEDIKGRRITERLDRLEETLISNEEAYDARKIYNGELEGGATTNFKFRMWLDYEATKESAASKTYKSKIVISAKDNINKDDEIIKIRYREEASEEGSNGWYKRYVTRVSISDKKDEEIKARYCVGTEKCEPNIEVELEEKSFTYEYESGSKILCTEASDRKGNRSEIVCNSIIKVDRTNPRVVYSIQEENKGTNEWYQSLKIEAKGEDNESGVAKLKYCVTTEERCEPSTSVEEGSTVIEITSNANAQKICSEVEDKNGNRSGVVCSEAYKVDGSSTTTRLSVASQTAGSNGWYKALSLKVEGTNSVSGVSSVKYCTTTSSTCTPGTNIANGGVVTLNSNANAQRVCAQTTDNKGVTSEIVCSEAYKVDASTTTINISIASQTAGSNGWYKALSLKAVGTNNYSGVSRMKYCTTTSSTCTPTSEVEGNNVTVLLSTNASAQKVCAQAIDNKGETSSVQCSGAYKVDETAPTVSITSSSSTTNSITVNISGNDAHSKISTYYYKIGSGSYTSDTSTTKTFTGLNAGTTYTISVYAVDKAGNQSTVVSKNVKVKTTIDNIISSSKDTPYDQIGNEDGVFKVEDGMYGGYSYYWSGNVANNYVKFAGFCWRAIRINGDGSLRLIYDGNTCHANGTVTTDNTIAFKTYLSIGGMYPENVGWTYVSGKQRSIAGTASLAKTTIEEWYNNNIGNNTEYTSKVANGKFCNDRETQEGVKWNRESSFQFAGMVRANSRKPTLSCHSGDVYSLKVGLITADEALYSKFTYLNNGKKWFTMTPASYTYTAEYSQTYGSPYMITINTYYFESIHIYNHAAYLRPVINLRADVNLTGSGTITNPYVVN